jgi:hypothetical protein
MDRTFNRLSGSSHLALVDHDIAHITRVMRLALHADLGGTVLPVAYWRERLYRLLDVGNLSHAQLCAIDSLLLQLTQFEADHPPVWDALAPPLLSTPRHAPGVARLS